MSAKKSIPCLLSVLFVIASMLAVEPLQGALAAGVRYAKPAAGGAGDCLSWANACTLQTALTGAAGGDEIWVAAGTYKPATGTARTATFQLKDGVALYGGFAGTETARDQRNPAVNVTVLSGDIDNDDSQTPIITDLTTVTGNATNSYHVVTGATGATLDGLTITAGYANGTSPDDFGGGMYNVGSSPTLANATFSGNVATSSSERPGGGGMYNGSNSNPTLTNVTFSNNYAYDGGGMYNTDSNPTLTNVTFSHNRASFGGGMFNGSSSDSTVSNVTFSDNRASAGGGMFNTAGSNPTVTDVTFSLNVATTSGGGMENRYNNPTLTNITFYLNSAPDGGGMENRHSNPMLTNVTFSGNTTVCGTGGGMSNNPTSNPTLTNVTFSGNEACSGNAMYNSTGSNAIIRNTIIWDNSTIYNYNSSPLVSDSVVRFGCPVGSSCTNIITADPKLGPLGNYGGATQTRPLQAGSSAIDTGNDAVCPATDQRGVARPQGAHCDIGAYEWYVDITAPIVESITRLNPSPTFLASVGFTVTFSESVTGVGVSDFSLTTAGISGASVTGVTGSGKTYTVTVNTGSGAGTLRLDVTDDDSILDLADNPLGGTGIGNGNFTGGETYAVRYHLIYLPLVLRF